LDQHIVRFGVTSKSLAVDMVTLRFAHIALVVTAVCMMIASLSGSVSQQTMAVAALFVAGQLVGQAAKG
jgi:hypothetical protein